jgi:hypothetical protein
VSSADAAAVEASIAALARSLDAHFAALEPWLACDEGLWRRRTAAGSWSVGEVLEHVALCNRYLLMLIEKLRRRALRRLAAGAPLPRTASDLSVLDALAQRELRWSHPPHMTPTGTAERGAIARELAVQREHCHELLRELPHGEGALESQRMSVVGARLDLYQYLRLVELHLVRHLRQMERIQKGDGGVPMA